MNAKFFLSIIITITSLLFDQISKIYIDKNINLFISIKPLTDFLNIVYVENRGISFGLLSEFNIPFILGILSIVISIYIFFLIYKSQDKIEIVGLSLILGGALGNGIDRMINGYVIDFIDLYYKDFHWPAFNLADSFITIGAILFFFRIYVQK